MGPARGAAARGPRRLGRPARCRPGCADLHDRGADRVAAQPLRDPAAPCAPASRPRGAGDLPHARARARRPRDRARQPAGRPGLGLPGQRARARTRRQRVGRRRAGVAEPQRRRRAGDGAGPLGAREPRLARGRRLGRDRGPDPRGPAAARGGLDRGDPRRRPVGLHAALRQPHRGGRARDGAARRRLASGRLPDPRAGRGLRLRPWPAAVLADHGHERRGHAVGPGLAGDLPGGQDLRAGLRRVLRVRGAHPLRRAGDRRHAAARGRAAGREPARRAVAGARIHRAPADRGPRRRAAGVLPGAADQPAAGDLRAAARGPALRVHRGVHRAADRGDPARDRRLPAPPPRPRAVGDADRRAARGGRLGRARRAASRRGSPPSVPSAAPRAAPARPPAPPAAPSWATATRRPRRPPPARPERLDGEPPPPPRSRRSRPRRSAAPTATGARWET